MKLQIEAVALTLKQPLSRKTAEAALMMLPRGDITLRNANVILAGLCAQPTCHGDIGDDFP